MVTKTLLIVSVLLTFGSTVSKRNKSLNFDDFQPKIVNGTDANIDDFPFVVSLQLILNETTSVHSCGGSILNEYWILTSAHCVVGGAPEEFLIEHSTTEISDGKNGLKIVYVEQLIFHEYFDDYKSLNDIGLVKLKTPLMIDHNDFKIRLPMKAQLVSSGSPAVLLGWGLTATNEDISTVLQKVDLQVWSKYDCAKIHDPNDLNANNICAGVPGGHKGPCSGDSGGPLLVNGVQVGIVSWSLKPCAAPPYPGVFTAVSSYIDWIQVNTGIKLNLNMFLQSTPQQ